ncbi:hypothetical protein CRENBAI_019372 [Crenichthys baileyi]|uniref:Uncharacterized protein n=1 Tax=Crenichthys baileyi TaxID=28760 RepID=A0AAV9R870_9TELE
MCVREHVPMEVRARELHPSSSVESARPVAMAAAMKAVSMAKGGSWHPPATDLPPLPLSPVPPPLPLRLAPDPPVNLPGGRRSMAQSCRVTVRDYEGENEKERSYTTQMGRRDEKMKR